MLLAVLGRFGDLVSRPHNTGAAIAVGATAVVAIAVLANLSFLSCMTIFG